MGLKSSWLVGHGMVAFSEVRIETPRKKSRFPELCPPLRFDVNGILPVDLDYPMCNHGLFWLKSLSNAFF